MFRASLDPLAQIRRDEPLAISPTLDYDDRISPCVPGVLAMSDAAPSKEDVKAAFKAFKKRLKLTRLDAESNLNYRPTSTGKGSGIVAIAAPDKFPQAVWDELVKLGKLKATRHGTYELLDES